MKWLACFLGFFALTAGCVLEDRPVGDGGADGSVCGPCEGEMPICNEGTQECVQCTVDDTRLCVDNTPLCDADGLCVACVADSDCIDAGAAKCDPELKECVPCDGDRQCDNIDGFAGVLNACNDEGECVDCTPASEAETCPGEFSCDPATEQCTQTKVGSLDVCEECVADSECGENNLPSADYRCVPMFYPDPQTRFPNDQTGFCLKTTAAGCQQPYSIPLLDRPSLSEPSVEDDYCGIDEPRVTCPAVRALIANDECPNGTPEECPPGGVCARVGGVDDRCTYLCGLPIQCPSDPPANTCGSSGSGDPHCGGG